MKKIFYLIPLFLLFLIPKSYALDCDMISSATLKDVFGSTSTGSISTGSLDTSSDNLLTCNPMYYAYGSSDSSQGLGWNINLTTLNSSNSYYQLTVFVRAESDVSIIASPFRGNSIAVGTSDASSLWASGNTNVSNLNYTINTIRNLEGKYGWTWYALSYIFKANTNFNNIFIPFATSSTTNANFYLGGITLNNTGTASLTSTEINSLLSNQSSQIQNDINNMGEDIKDSIDDNFNSCRDSVNLIDFSDNNRTSNGISASVSNNVFTISGTPSASYANITPNTNFNIPKGTYTFSLSNTVSFNVVLRLTLSDGSRADYTINSGSRSVTFTTSTNSTIYLFFISSLSSSKTYNETFKIQLQEGTKATSWEPPNEEVCKNKIDETNDKLDDVTGSINDLNSSINNSNSNGATDSAGNFFNNFEDNDFGLSGIITAPLNTIKTITSNTCTPINLNIPFVNKNMSLPCMTDIYEEHFSSFLDIYQIITFGMISYWVCVQIYAMVKGFKNPDKDEIEVMDL